MRRLLTQPGHAALLTDGSEGAVLGSFLLAAAEGLHVQVSTCVQRPALLVSAHHMCSQHLYVRAIAMAPTPSCMSCAVLLLLHYTRLGARTQAVVDSGAATSFPATVVVCLVEDEPEATADTLSQCYDVSGLHWGSAASLDKAEQLRGSAFLRGDMRSARQVSSVRCMLCSQPLPWCQRPALGQRCKPGQGTTCKHSAMSLADDMLLASSVTGNMLQAW